MEKGEKKICIFLHYSVPRSSEIYLDNWFKLANFLTKHEELLTSHQDKDLLFNLQILGLCCSSSYTSLYNVGEQL